MNKVIKPRTSSSAQIPAGKNSTIDSSKARTEALVEKILARAKAAGASAAEVDASESTGLSVAVRQQSLETLEFTNDRGFHVTVYDGQRKGSVSTTDTRDAAIEEAVGKALAIARFAEEDPYAGLAEAELMASMPVADLDLYHPWDIEPEAAQALAMEVEAAGLDADERICNSEGGQVDSHAGIRIYGNSHGFMGSVAGSRHSVSCVLLGRGKDDAMQRDYWYSSARNAQDLQSAIEIGLTAALRTVARLDARSIATRQVPVVFSTELAGGVLGHLMSAIAGGSQYRRSSFLLDSLGETVMNPRYSVTEYPLLAGEVGSAPFDGDGLQTREKRFVEQGVLQSYVLGTYSARRLKLQSTANAGGVHNLRINHDGLDQAALLENMGEGLLVTELMGQGVNMVTGDYSRGAAGFWIENGKIAYPVHEVTIAANLRDMLMNIVAVADDADTRGNIRCGSLWIDGMTVAGQ